MLALTDVAQWLGFDQEYDYLKWLDATPDEEIKQRIRETEPTA